MGFIEKVKQVVTGKNEIERLQEQQANKVIRAKAISASLQERQKQAIRVAIEREKVNADNRIKKLREPRPSFWNAQVQSTMGLPFGSPIQQQTMSVNNKPRFYYIKKGKRYIKKRVKSNKPTQPSAPQRYDVLGSIGSFGTGQRYRVI